MLSIYSSNFQSKLITFGIIYSRKQRSFLTVKPKPFFSFTIFISLSFPLSDTSHSSIKTLSYCNEYLFRVCCFTWLDENWGEIESVRRYRYNILFIRTKLNIPRWVNKTYMNTRRIGWGEKNRSVRTTPWDGREGMNLYSLSLFVPFIPELSN